MRKLEFGMLILFFLSFATYAGEHISRDELARSVNGFAKNLPIQVDSVTTLASVVLLKGSNIQYKYSLDLKKVIELAARQKNISVEEFRKNSIRRFGSIDKVLKTWSESVLKSKFANNNCTNPETRRWIDDGVNIVHTIYDTKGIFFYEVKITKNVCIHGT